MPQPSGSGSSNKSRNGSSTKDGASSSTKTGTKVDHSAIDSADLNGGSRFRHRKISVKQRLRIYKPNDLKNLDKEELQQRVAADIETGVEKNEEKEVHLHRILQKGSSQLSGQKKDYIPTPDASETWKEYKDFYQGKFLEPTSYIRFSATVEDCCGCSYNMDETDDTFLSDEINQKEQTVLSEDEFELICSAFENAIQERQPFLNTDPQSILSFEELKPTLLKSDFNYQGLKINLAKEIGYSSSKPLITQFDSSSQIDSRPLNVLLEKFGKQVYEHWKYRKIESPNTEIFPKLKFERPDEKEEVDPYVCFRRRDVRQPRKTRRIDILNSHKLRILLQELQHAKKLALLVARREQVSMDLLEKDTKIFSERSEFKTLKRALSVKSDDELFFNQKRKRLNIFANQRKQQQLAAESAIASDSSVRKGVKQKVSKKELEHASRSGQKPNKQQPQSLKVAGVAAGTPTNNKQQSLPEDQEGQLGPQGQQSQMTASHVYVRLPSSKVPDVVLEEVDDLLSSKEKNAKKFVQDRMEKRKLEDGDVFFNVTDDPHNPVFDIILPKDVIPSNAPFSSIASSRFEIDRSYYSPNLPDYINGTTPDITAFSKAGEKLSDKNAKIKKLELYDTFQNNNEVHSREYPVKFRRRFGRHGIQYIDRKPNHFKDNVESILGKFLNFDEIEQQEKSSTDAINVYESKWDELSRLYDKWKYDSPRNEYGSKVSEEPSRLNQISNDTQVIRFGTMLGSKSYEQLREVTIKYRQEYLSRVRQQKINNQKQLQLQQQQLQQQQQQLQQQHLQQVNDKSHNNSTPVSRTPSKMASPSLPNKVNGTPGSSEVQNLFSGTQKKSSSSQTA